MNSRLPTLLTTDDFSEAELCALVLDGTLYRVGDCFSVVDQLPSVWLRAHSLALVLPPRLIAERRTAAWVWAAVNDPPPSHHVCVDITSRVRPTGVQRLIVREVVITENEWCDFGDIRVTTAERTAIDLARTAGEFGDDDVEIIARLMHNEHFGVQQCSEAIERRRNLPNKKLALSRLIRGAERAHQLPVIAEAVGADPLAVPYCAEPE